MTPSEYQRLFKYEFWSNRLVADALRDEAGPPLTLLAHILASQRLWLDRMTGNPQALPVWPALSKRDCIRLLGDLETDCSMFLDGLSEERLALSYEYVNTKGDSWTSTVADTLTHIITHSCYHRGQIALRMREAGQDPPYTDFIQAARRNLI